MGRMLSTALAAALLMGGSAAAFFHNLFKILFSLSMVSKAKAFMTLTENAASRIKFLLTKQPDPNMSVKIGVRRRGCNGLSYTMNYAEKAERLDEVIEDKGVKIILDSKALMVLVGTQMDYLEDDLKAEFVFKNPNEKGKCGCGESFNI